MEDKIIDRISYVYKKVSHAAMRVDRDPASIKVVGVTKRVVAEKISEAIDAGMRIFGENYIQEARDKIDNITGFMSDSDISWHLLGHLQKNKAKTAVNCFDLIHTLDSPSLAEELNKHAEKSSKVQRLLIQVNVSGEESKHGTTEEDLYCIIDKVRKLANLKLEGLMAIPMFFNNPEMVRPSFRRLRELRDKAEERYGTELPELSMGMSGDYEVAVEEGATLVRVGTAIFGTRAQ